MSGEVGVAVRDIETGNDFGYNASEIFPTASTLKVPLIYALYRRAEASEIDLTERVTLSYTNRVPGSGVLQHMDEGLQPTLRDLAELMIIVSDNWATDLLWNRLTKSTVDATLAEIGMGQTSLPYTIYELFATLAEADPSAPETTYEYLETFLKDYDPKPDNPAMVFDARNDTSSPVDMVRLLTAIDAGEGIEASRRRELAPQRIPAVEDPTQVDQRVGIALVRREIGKTGQRTFELRQLVPRLRLRRQILGLKHEEPVSYTHLTLPTIYSV